MDVLCPGLTTSEFASDVWNPYTRSETQKPDKQQYRAAGYEPGHECKEVKVDKAL